MLPTNSSNTNTLAANEKVINDSLNKDNAAQCPLPGMAAGHDKHYRPREKPAQPKIQC
jgi:hypothetical protein